MYNVVTRYVYFYGCTAANILPGHFLLATYCLLRNCISNSNSIIYAYHLGGARKCLPSKINHSIQYRS